MAREQKAKAKTQSEEEIDDVPHVSASTATDEVDDLLDEIDGVLEENAAEFVRGYVQKGGE